MWSWSKFKRKFKSAFSFAKKTRKFLDKSGIGKWVPYYSQATGAIDLAAKYATPAMKAFSFAKSGNVGGALGAVMEGVSVAQTAEADIAALTSQTEAIPAGRGFDMAQIAAFLKPS